MTMTMAEIATKHQKYAGLEKILKERAPVTITNGHTGGAMGRWNKSVKQRSGCGEGHATERMAGPRFLKASLAYVDREVHRS